MSGEGSSNVGGSGSTQASYASSTGTSGALKGSAPQGNFNTSSLTQYPSQKHIPDVRLELHEFKPLHQWEVEVSLLENKYFRLVKKLQEPLTDTQDNRETLQTLINSVIEAGHQVIAQYQTRLQEQHHQGLIDSDTIDQLSQSLQQDAASAVSRLYELQQKISSTSKTWGFRKKKLALPEIKESLQTFNGALQKTKDQIRASSGEDISPSSEWEQLGTQLEALQTQLNKKVANFQELEAHLQQGNQLVEQLMTHSSQLMSRTEEDVKTQTLMMENQLQLARYQELLQHVEFKGGFLSSAESQKSKVQEPLQGIIDAARQLQPWIPAIVAAEPTAATAAPSSLSNPTLQQLASKLKTATTSKTQKEVQAEIDQFVSEQQKEYGKLIPLLSIATVKQDSLGGNLVPEVSDCLNELNTLAMTRKMLEEVKTNKEYSEALKKIDKALTYLESFNTNMPDQVYHLLTESLPEEPTETEHLNNLLCRSTFSEPPQRLSEKKHLSILTAMHEYQIQLAKQSSETHDQKSFLAHRQIVGKAFSSPEWVRALTEQAKNLEELRALSHVLPYWEGLQHALLDQAYEDLQTLKADMVMPKIENGRESIRQMTTLFDDSIKQYTEHVEAYRRAQLQQFTYQAIEEYIAHRFNNPSLLRMELLKSTEALCRNLQEELNKALDGIAKVTLIPDQNEEGDGIQHRIEMQMHDPKKSEQDFNRLMRSKHAIAKGIVKHIPTDDPDPLLHFDPVQKRYTWVPHPTSEVQVCGEAFAGAFDTHTGAILEAKEQHERIRRYAETRQKAKEKVEEVVLAVVSTQNVLPTQSEESQEGATKKLKEIKNKLQNVKTAPMKKMAEEAVECRDNVVAMLRQQQITASQAENMLTSLFSLLHTLDERYTAQQAVMPEKITMDPPPALMTEIHKLEKPPRAAFLLHVFAKERMKAFEQTKSMVKYTKSLVEICSKSLNMPLQAINILDEHAMFLQNEGLTELSAQVKLYSDDLYLKMRNIDEPQKFPDLQEPENNNLT
ncbi:hypothetical protein [Parendozoicomonas sp. Alg238-R29]|uniref:hypothetical protein n=1 Tax=Parendozoicomonas sp. Alg238-R29 TaxID=2993446 RepID=UPI00248DC167|nr:hypothetical protein [Parendozoicomonas sp. Alg238-R29]